MEHPIFDTIETDPGNPAGTSHSGQRHNFDVPVRHVLDDRQIGEATVRAYMTDSAIGAAQLPVEEYVVRWVEHVAFGLNDGRKLERLLERVQQEGGTLNLPRPADVQDYAQPVSPRASLPVGFR